jgi:hypothetical protein
VDGNKLPSEARTAWKQQRCKPWIFDKLIDKGSMATDSSDEISPLEVLIAEDAREVRDIVVWLLRSAGYRALAVVDRSVTKSLFLRRCPMLVVGTVPTVFSEGLDLLAFVSMLHPDIPVLIVSGAAFDRWPEVERGARGVPRKPCDSASFRTRVQCLISQVITRQNLRQPCPSLGRSPDRGRHTSGDPTDRPLCPLDSHAPAHR